MEDLNKNQIILLTLLVSFVTSIGTGIMTTSLLMEAPVEVTNTINRVVEKTVETVVPAQVVDNIKPQKEIQTVVVSEEDRVIDSINKNSKSIVRIYSINKELDVRLLYGIGVILNKDGIIISDKKNISEAMSYEAVMYDGEIVSLVPVTGIKTNAGFFVAKPKEGYNMIPASILNSTIKLGQSVVSIGGDTTNSISVGRVSSINTREIGTSTKIVSSIETDISQKDNVYGSPIVTLSGDFAGINLSTFSSSKIFLPVNIIKEDLVLLNAPKNSN